MYNKKQTILFRTLLKKTLVFLSLSLFSHFHTLASEVTDTVVAVKDTVLSKRSGTASYYARKFNGRRTSNGERVNNNGYTCAHPHLPYGTFVRVTNKRNAKSVVVRVNDRFRPQRDHLVDITLAAARDIDMIRDGIVRITLEVLDTRVGEILLPKDTLLTVLPMPVGIPLCPLPVKPECLAPETVAVPK
jgi:rare lipoprotein A